LRPLPVWEPDRLVQITRLMPDGKPGVVSYPLFQYFRDNLKSISEAAVQVYSRPTIAMDGVEDSIGAEVVSGTHYSLLGLEPAAGRLLAPEDDVSAPASPAAVIGYRYWQRRFGLSPTAIGKTFTLRNKVFTIVGVTPPRYQGTRPERDPDITLPLSVMLNEDQRREPTNNVFNMMGRLKPGVTIRQANAELQVLWQGFAQRLAAGSPEKSRPGILRERAAVLRGANGISGLGNYLFGSAAGADGHRCASSAAGLREPGGPAAGEGGVAAA
jgi:hypothetical protein